MLADTLRLESVFQELRKYFGRLQYNTGIRINNGLIRDGHNVISLSDRDIINYSKSFKDPTGSKYLNNLISETINNCFRFIITVSHIFNNDIAIFESRFINT